MVWFFGTISGSRIDEFAKSLARELAEQFPPDHEKDEEEMANRKVFAVLDRIFAKARAFRTEHRLGVYKKARLANTFRWALEETGYSGKFVEFATEGLVVTLTQKD